MSEEPINAEGLKLYRASVEVVYYVAARNEVEAREVASDSFRAAAEEDWFPDPFVSPARRQWIEADWLDAIPYTAPDDNEADLTCADILDNPPPHTERELEAAGQINLLDGAA